MKELPILFSTPMVQALLDGRKTMTRRIMGNGVGFSYTFKRFGKQTAACAIMDISKLPQSEINSLANHAKYKTGDLLWVRETYCPTLSDEYTHKFTKLPFFYKADFVTPKQIEAAKNTMKEFGLKYKPSIFMPKTAARIWLRVTNVKCERLLDINHGDAIKEGIRIMFEENKKPVFLKSLISIDNHFKTPMLAFMSLWESINGSGSSKENPWVFVYEFDVLSTSGKPDEKKL